MTKKTREKNKAQAEELYINKLLTPKEIKDFKKVEKYVNKDRDKTSQEILERKINRPNRKYTESDLEIIYSRIDAVCDNAKKKKKKSHKGLFYTIYILVMALIMIYVMKYFIGGNLPQIS